jgi:hypothetical protein
VAYLNLNLESCTVGQGVFQAGLMLNTEAWKGNILEEYSSCVMLEVIVRPMKEPSQAGPSLNQLGQALLEKEF